MSSASSSFAVPPRRPIGLMVIVLLVDLGLAAAGAVLLSKGLASEDAQAAPAPTEKKTEATTTSPDASAAAAAAAAPAAEPEPAAPVIAAAPAPAASAAAHASAAATSAVPAARKDTAKQRDDKSIRTSSKAAKSVKAPATTAKTNAQPAERPSDTPVTRPSDAPADSGARPVTAVPSEPQDPYEAPDTAREVERLAGRSNASFERCKTNFGPAHGTIQIAFQIKPDGRVANAAAVENSTGNTDLANCLVTVVSSWRVSAHQGEAINMVRPFTYP